MKCEQLLYLQMQSVIIAQLECVTLVFQCDQTFIGNADEDSGNSGSECKGFD